MGYLAYIDYKNLDNSLFLKSLAGATSSQDPGITPRIFIHSDSEYTERLIQTGMMREDAQSRAIRELNRRLVAEFADHGVSAIGLNGYQRRLVTFDGESDELTIDHDYLLSLPPQPVLIISNLIHVVGEEQPRVFPIQKYLAGMIDLPGVSHFYAFSSTERMPSVDNFNQPESPNTQKNEKKSGKQSLPHELVETSLDVEIISIDKFSHLIDK